MIIAVDFDGILCQSAFPDIGEADYEMISFVRQLIDEGHEVVLWTSRAGDRLDEAVAWCEDYGLHFCAVNENAPSNAAQYLGEYPTPSPKIYADLYLEDHCPWFIEYERRRNRVKDAKATAMLIEHTRRTLGRLKTETKEEHDG